MTLIGKSRSLACRNWSFFNTNPFCALLLLSAFCGCLGAESTVCQTSPSTVAVVGQPFAITCRIDRELLTDTRQSIYLFQHDDLEIPNLIFKRSWLIGAREPECTLTKGFTSDCKVSNGALTIEIPAITTQHAGVYRCQHSAKDRTRHGSCTVTVMGDKVACTGARVNKGDAASVTCHFGFHINKPHNFQFFINRERNGHHRIVDKMLTCNKLPDGNEYYCLTSRGENFVTNVTDVYTWPIPNASDSDSGTYVCGIVPTPPGVSSTSCNVQVLDKESNPPARLVIEDKGTGSLHHWQDVETTSTELTTYHSTHTQKVENDSAGKFSNIWIVSLLPLFAYIKTRRQHLYPYLNMAALAAMYPLRLLAVLIKANACIIDLDLINLEQNKFTIF